MGVCLVISTAQVHSLSINLTPQEVVPEPVSIYTPEEIKSGIQEIGEQSLQIAADARALMPARKEQQEAVQAEETKKIEKVKEEQRESAIVKKELDDKIDEVTKEVIAHKLET